MLCRSLPPLPTVLELASAWALDPYIGRGGLRGGWELGGASSFLLESRHRFFLSFSFSLSVCVSGFPVSTPVGWSSSTWSRSDPSLNELCSEVGGDFFALSVASAL